MKDLDTKILSQMYNEVHGILPTASRLIVEDVNDNSSDVVNTIISRFANQDTVTSTNLAWSLVGFIKRDVPLCENVNVLNKNADVLLENVNKINRDPMITRVLKDYEDMSSVSKLKAIYKLVAL